MTAKERAEDIYEKMKTVIGESDLHIPPWISNVPALDYPIEEKEVCKLCAKICVDEILKEVHTETLDTYKGETRFIINDRYLYWQEVKTELDKL